LILIAEMAMDRIRDIHAKCRLQRGSRDTELPIRGSKSYSRRGVCARAVRH